MNSTKELLGNYIDHIKGYAFKSSDMSNELKNGIPVVKVKDFTDYSLNMDAVEVLPYSFAKTYRKFIINPRDILISSVGSWPNNPASVVGKVTRVPYYNENILLNQNIVKVFSKSKLLNNDFLFWLLKDSKFNKYLVSTAQGSANQASITLKSIDSYMFTLPTLIIQQKIVNQLDSIQQKIELNNKIISTLEVISTTLFNHWFVDFEFPDKNGNPYKSSGGKMIESELGEIPEEFQLVELGNIIENIKDKILVEDLSLDNYASTENLLAGKLGKMQATKLPTVKAVKCYRSDDILISNIRPYFKKIWKAVGKGGYSNDVLNFRAKRAICLPEFLYSFLQRDDFFEFMTLTSKGTKMPRGDKQAIATLKLALPNMDTMLCYSEKTIPLFNMINQRKSENETLKELRDTLLPKLLSGEIELE